MVVWGKIPNGLLNQHLQQHSFQFTILRCFTYKLLKFNFRIQRHTNYLVLNSILSPTPNAVMTQNKFMSSVVRISGCLGNSPHNCAIARESNAAQQAAWNSSDEVAVKDSLGNLKRFFSKLGETTENSDRWLVHATNGLKNKWWNLIVLMGYILVLAVLVCNWNQA